MKILKKKTILPGKNCYTLSFFNIRRTRFDQSSAVQPISDFRAGGFPEPDKEQTNERKSLCLILDLRLS